MRMGKRMGRMAVCLLLLAAAVGCGAQEERPASSSSVQEERPASSSSAQNSERTPPREIEWVEISPQGVDEEALIRNVDRTALEKIAALLQELTGEIETKQREDPAFAMSADWFSYARGSERYQTVVRMGDKAAKPLYLILYKSPNQGLFEYICAMALDEITGYDHPDWKTSKEFLTVLNRAILAQQ